MRTIRGGGVRALVLAIAMAIQAGCDEEPVKSWVDQFGTAQNDTCMGLSADRHFLYAYGRAGLALPGQVSAGNQDVYLRKYDVRGEEIWTRQFGTTGLDDCLWGNVEAQHGRIIVGGSVRGALPGQTYLGEADAFLRAYDADGDVLWTRQFGTTAVDVVRNVALDENDDIYIAALTEGALPGQTHAGDRDIVVQKYDPDGNLVWTFQFGSTGFDEAIGVEVRGHFVYATGVTRSVLPGQTSAGATDGFLVKLTAEDGQMVWLRQFGGTGVDSPWKVKTIGSDVFVGGHTSGDLGAPNAGVQDPFLARFSPDGDLQWVRQFGSPGLDNGFSMTVHEGGIALAGGAGGAMPGQVHAGEMDFYVRKYDADGNELWTLQWGTSATDTLTAIAAHGGDLYVSGGSTGALPDKVNAGAFDAVVIKIGAEDRESALD